MNLLQIRVEFIKNMDSWERSIIRKVVKDNPKKFNKFIGFVEARVYTTTKGKIIIHKYPINGNATENFRRALKKSGISWIGKSPGRRKTKLKRKKNG